MPTSGAQIKPGTAHYHSHCFSLIVSPATLEGATPDYPALSRTIPLDRPPLTDHYPTMDSNLSSRNDEWHVYFYLVGIN